jgi:hypothetical protein
MRLSSIASAFALAIIGAILPNTAYAAPVNGQATSHTCEAITHCAVWEDVATLNYTYDVGRPYVHKNWLDCHVEHQYTGVTVSETWCGVWNDGGGIPNSAGQYPYMNAGDNFEVCSLNVNCQHHWQRVNVDVYGHIWRTGDVATTSH